MNNQELFSMDDIVFQKELKKLFHHRLYLLFWLGFFLFPLFLFLDYYAVRNLFSQFFLYRMVCSAAMMVLLAIHFTRFGRKYPFVTAMAGYVICGIAVSMMVVKMGGYDSFYYVGMIGLVVAFSSILPLTFFQSLVSGLTMYLIYFVPVMAFSDPVSPTHVMFFSNNFFFIFFILVCVVKSREDHNARRLGIQLRHNTDYYATHLENEVAKRAKKLEESELRYRELYENIMDSVLMVDASGIIVIANPNFYRMIGTTGSSNRPLLFADYVHAEDYPDLNYFMIDGLANNREIKDYQFRLVNREGEIIHVECNATVISKKGEVLGFQLVLRDITFRKELEKDLLDSLSSLKRIRAATILGLAKLTEYRDHDTGGHLERIQEYSRVLTSELRRFPGFASYITDAYIDDIHLSSILHDIGKVGIPDAVLLKPGRLTAKEFKVIQQHCTYGGDAIRAVDSKIGGQSFLTLGKEIAYCHHEKWSGKGYPKGLKGDEIPLSARIVALTDVYDALTSKRVYKEALSHEAAMAIINSERGGHFDPLIVDAFSACSKDFDTIRLEFNA
jgi:PAS domain S-box-containing protein